MEIVRVSVIDKAFENLWLDDYTPREEEFLSRVEDIVMGQVSYYKKEI